jgi:hypothetical protein
VEVEEKTQDSIEPPNKGEPGAKPDDTKKTALDPTNYNSQVEKMSDKKVLELARKALGKAMNGQPRVVQQAPIAHSFVELVEKASPARETVAMESVPAEKPVVTAATTKSRGLLVASQRPSAQVYVNTVPSAQIVSDAPVVSTPSKPMTPVSLLPKVTAADLPKEHAPVQAKEGKKDMDEKGRMLARLHHSTHDDEREIAVNRLATMTGSGKGEILKEIESAAISDKAPTVRAACLRAFAKMNVKDEAVLTIVERLRTDPSPLVRHEADKTMSTLTSVQSSYAPTSGVRKASAESSLRIP